MTSGDEVAVGVLEARHVSVSYDGFHALDNATVNLARGAITGFIGPNGAGKSTLFNVLAGSSSPSAGEVRLNGAEVTRRPPQWRARHGLTRTFQISRELGRLSVLENLLLASPDQAGETVAGALFRRGAMRRSQEAAIERAHDLLQRVDLWRLADQPAAVLSGGQKKLLELCRALMLEPSVVLLDEPAAGVNPTRIGEISEFIRALRSASLTLGIIEHNMDMVAALCDKVYVLAEGRILREGSFDDVASDPQVTSAYFGNLS
ncbi:ABC transporter ATP-binding protein [Bradyrhizobium sp.]|uniref:ABC transporter ATP-binding protein n=1 Tax=Bradyrhizobium sp. TaxID=376 RepID=UPI0039E378C9